MKKSVRLALFLALAIVLSIIESYIPFFNGVVPGLKIGLANVVVLFVLYYYSIKEAAFISILRVLVVGLLRTGLFSVTFTFSLTGAIFALIFMYLAHRFFKFSVIGVSVVGSIMHTVGQLLCVSIMFNTANLSFYIPIVLLISLPTGIIVGYLADKIIDLMNKIDRVEREDERVLEEVEDIEEISINELIDVTQKIPTLKELVDASTVEPVNTVSLENTVNLSSDVEIISENIDMPLKTKEKKENAEKENTDDSIISTNDTTETKNDVANSIVNDKENIEKDNSKNNKDKGITDWDMPTIENKRPKKDNQKKATNSSKSKKKKKKNK